MVYSEDQVKQEVRDKLELTIANSKAIKQGTGQHTSFKELLGISKNEGGLKSPDAWYLPNNKNQVAIIAELKNSTIEFKKAREQLEDYIQIVRKEGYEKVVGLFYNGQTSIIYKNLEQFQEANKLYDKNYYLNLFNPSTIDKQAIYNLTKRINDNLHFNFGISNLKFRMVFTACALVAEKNGANLKALKNMGFEILSKAIIKTLEESYQNEIAKNLKLNIIKEQYQAINFNYTENKEAINDFIECICGLSAKVRFDFYKNEYNYLSGEDVMAIFFNEFTRYKGKAEAGQVFTPDHIASLMCKMLDLDYEDKVLDATCGSGSFLIKAMADMLNKAGGSFNETERDKIYKERIFGIEFHKELFALACANMLIHKDGKTNLENLDARSKEACLWIKQRKINKVLMNPPYNNKDGVYEIIENVLDSVEKGAMCAFLLPDNKLEVRRAKVEKWLTRHSLLKIIKLPNEVFAGMAGITTSIFLFQAHKPQGNKEIFACHIKEDGLETVKLKGKQDIKGIWARELEGYWLNVIRRQSGDESCQWLKPSEHLSYQMPQEPFSISEQDFKRVVLDFMLFENGIDKKEFEKAMLESLLYDSKIELKDSEILVRFDKAKEVDTRKKPSQKSLFDKEEE